VPRDKLGAYSSSADLFLFTSTTDTQTQVRLSFDTLEEAEAYARDNGIPYVVLPPHTPTPKRNSYSDNFRFDRKTPWTH